MENIAEMDYKLTFSNTLNPIQISTAEQKEGSITTNICITCSKSNRAVAFVPCAHYVTCLTCGHGTTACPMCGSKIRAYVRIYE
jgi:hypothetical protein